MKIISNLKDYIFILFAFAIPFSVAITNILIVVFTLLWIFEGKFQNKLKIIKSNYWIFSIFILAILYLIGLTYGEFHSDAPYVFKRVLLLLFFIPIYTSKLSMYVYKKSIIFFVAANLISALYAILINMDFVNPLYSTTSHAAFLRYNYHNILLSFSALLSYILFIKSKSKYSYLFLFFILIFSVSIFTERGRAGQLAFNIFFFLIAVFSIRKKISHFISIILFLLLLNFFSYSNSKIFKNRVDNLTHVVKNNGVIKGKSEKKIALRYAFYDVVLPLIPTKPFFGHGTGSFSETFLKAVESKDMIKYIDHEKYWVHKTPHNHYVYILFELGFFGLLVFLSVFYFQIKKIIDNKKLELIILPLFIMFLMLFDSYMFIFTITVFYIYMYKIFDNLSFK